MKFVVGCIFLLFTLYSSDALSNVCNMCLDIAARAKKHGSDSESLTKAKALDGANTYPTSMQQEYIDELNCHWDKYYKDANMGNNIPNLQTCADTGLCPLSNQYNPYKLFDVTNDTIHWGHTCVKPQIILLHHTETATSQETIDVLNNRGLSVQYIVGHTGDIYQLVSDWHRAWHAGRGSWRNVTDVNSFSIGIEIVNSGESPFEQAQLDSVFALVANLKQRWWIDDSYIIGHMEIRPEGKEDPSGYFPWKELDDSINIFSGLFNSTLTAEQQKSVLIGNGTTNTSLITIVQQGLRIHGYTHLVSTPGVYDGNMKQNIQAFNRRYCPEVFIKEKINHVTNTTIELPANQQWYALSNERLDYLLNMSK